MCVCIHVGTNDHSYSRDALGQLLQTVQSDPRYCGNTHVPGLCCKFVCREYQYQIVIGYQRRKRIERRESSIHSHQKNDKEIEQKR